MEEENNKEKEQKENNENVQEEQVKSEEIEKEELKVEGNQEEKTEKKQAEQVEEKQELKVEESQEATDKKQEQKTEDNQMVSDKTQELKTEERKIEEKKEQKKMKKNKADNAEEGKNKKTKRTLLIVILTAVIVFTALFVSIIFSLLNMNNEKILDGISILGIDISGLTADEAKAQINDAIENRFKDENNNLILKRNEEETNVTANTFNAKFDVEKAVAKAHNIGRDGNIITNNYAILFTKLFKKDIQPELYLDEELLNKTISSINSKMKDAVVESSYYVENDKLIIVKGKDGYIIDQDKLKEEIYNQLSNIHENYQVIEIPIIYKVADAINLEKIHSEIYKEPKDAYVEKNPTKVIPHVDGVDFAISMEEAKKIIEEDKEEYTIPLKITVPKKTISDLGEEAFPDLLATFSTIYDPSNRNRSTNIELASKKINGTVVMPGEKFSYNTVVGKRTIEAGFKEGTAYIGGKVVPDIGGGVCQLSSTLYNAALLANLEIVERSNHLFLTGYVSPSRDATVYYGSLDFVFKNTRTYPIKIVSSSKNGVCKTSIYGIKEKVEYEVVIQPKVTSYINYSTTYKNDPTLEEGKEVVEQSGVNGCRSEAYRILKLNGKVVSQKLLSKDTYSAKQKIVRRGTKKVNTQTTTNTTAQ